MSAEGDVSSFAALCTALSATIGTGNIVGVATAVKAGGPGAIFWMWVAAFFGIGTFAQVNAIKDAAQLTFNIPVPVTAVILTILVTIVTLGGIKSIARVATTIVPFMAIFYILGSLAILLLNYDLVPAAIALVIESAFNPQAAFGGAAGITVIMVMRSGIARGVFSNESGLGSALMAIPNLIGLIGLSSVVFSETKKALNSIS